MHVLLCLCTAPDTAPEGQRINMKILSDDPKTGVYTYVRSMSRIAANGFSKGAERVLRFNGKCLLLSRFPPFYYPHDPLTRNAVRLGALDLKFFGTNTMV
jgi:hypothetical protein